MSAITQTVTETTVAVISPTIVSDVTTTVTSHLETTLLATQGQTVTITSPSLSTSPLPTTRYSPTTTTRTSTVTLTEIDIYLQNANDEIYSTWIVSLEPIPAPSGRATPTATQGSLVYVVEPNANSWDSWSKGERVGLIVGVVLAAVLTFAIFYCCFKKWNVWFTYGWPLMTQAAPPPSTPVPSMVLSTQVNGPVAPYYYGYNGRAAYGNV